jgi:hypothetical protein
MTSSPALVVSFAKFDAAYPCNFCLCIRIYMCYGLGLSFACRWRACLTVALGHSLYVLEAYRLLKQVSAFQWVLIVSI